jgi:hypothetical protein
MRQRSPLMVKRGGCILTIGREASRGCQTGERNAEDRSCDAGRRWVRARRYVRRFCGTGQCQGYCRIRALGRPGHARPRLVRARPAPTFWTLCARMRTRLVPALSASTLPSQVMACRISSPRFLRLPYPKDSTPMTISMYNASAPIFVQFLTSRAPDHMTPLRGYSRQNGSARCQVVVVSRSASESSHGDRITNRHPATMRARLAPPSRSSPAGAAQP